MMGWQWRQLDNMKSFVDPITQHFYVLGALHAAKPTMSEHLR